MEGQGGKPVGRLTRPENGGDMEQVSEICRLAYNDMSEAKKNVRRRLEEYVEDFLCEWRTGQEKVNRLMQDIDGVRDQAKESFIAAADEILTRFGELETDSLTMREKLENTEETETEMRGRFEQMLKALAEGEAAGMSAEEPAVVEEPLRRNPGNPPLFCALLPNGAARPITSRWLRRSAARKRRLKKRRNRRRIHSWRRESSAFRSG